MRNENSKLGMVLGREFLHIQIDARQIEPTLLGKSKRCLPISRNNISIDISFLLQYNS